MSTALILGIGGQDGSYLADILTDRGWSVHGLYRRSSCDNLWRIVHLRDKVTLHRGDVIDRKSVQRAVENSGASVIYNMADQDNVAWSREIPKYQQLVTYEAVANLLDILDRLGDGRKMFQPLSCTMFGCAPPPQHEESQVNPSSPYAKWKDVAWDVCKAYRRGGVYVSCGIMFGHDSPRRSPHYLLQKICREAVELAQGRREVIALGSLDTRVDVGYAREYMEAAVQIMELPEPGDYCVGTGQSWSIREMLERAFDHLASKHKYVVEDWQDCIGIDPAYADKVEPTYRADATKLKAATGWESRYNAGKVIEMLIDHFVKGSAK